MSANFTVPDNHSIVLAGHIANKNQESLRRWFKTTFNNKLQTHLAQEIGEDAAHTILVLGKNAGEKAVERAKNMNAVIVKQAWVEELFKAKKWVPPKPDHIEWKPDDINMPDFSGINANGKSKKNSTANNVAAAYVSPAATPGRELGPGESSSEEPVPEPDNEPVPEPDNEPAPEPDNEPAPEPDNEPVPEPDNEPVPEPDNEPVPEPDNEPVPEPDNEPENEPAPRLNSKPATGQTLEPSSYTGPNTNEKDPIRKAWYDQVKGGPWTIPVLHPADKLKNSYTPRLDYVMRIEGLYMNWFVVSDPATKTFKEHPQLRDVFLIPTSTSPGLKEEYIKKNGNYFFRRTKESLAGWQYKQFNFWGIAFNGRMCMVIGNLPTDTKPGIWSRTDLKGAWGVKFDRMIDSIRASMGHPPISTFKKDRIQASDIDQMKESLQKRGPAVQVELTAETEEEAVAREPRQLDLMALREA